MPLTANTLLDDAAIRRLRQQWAFSRDQSDFESMSGCFHADASASIAWFSGPVSKLIPMLAAGDAARKRPEHSKHVLGNCLTHIVGDRALMETDVTILMRELIDDQLFDYTGHARFFDRVERREGTWAITEWTAIFDKDRLDPVQGAAPAWLREVALEGESSSFAFMRLRQLRKGRAIPEHTVMGGSKAESDLRARAFTWLYESSESSSQRSRLK